MRPVLLSIWGLEFHAYPVCIAVAFVVGSLLSVRECLVRGEKFMLSPRTGVWAFLAGLFGAKVFYILQYSEPKYLWHAFVLWEAGLVFYGGLIGATLAAIIDFLIHRVPLLKAGDIVIPYLAMGEAITRVGCFLNGCCWGAPTSVPWAVRFPPDSSAYQILVERGVLPESAPSTPPVHPTQLYMVAGLIIAMILLKLCLKRKKFDGAVLLLYCFLYGGLRFVVEIFRGDSARSVFGMTVSQAISLGLVMFAAITFAAVKLGVFGASVPSPRHALAQDSADLAPSNGPKASPTSPGADNAQNSGPTST